jgi:hypothetical protein
MESHEMFMSLALSLLLLPACQHKARPIFFDDIDDAIEDCKLPKINDATARTLRNDNSYEEEIIRYDDEEWYWDDRGGTYKPKPLSA